MEPCKYCGTDLLRNGLDKSLRCINCGASPSAEAKYRLLCQPAFVVSHLAQSEVRNFGPGAIIEIEKPGTLITHYTRSTGPK